jgi:hypothetical protein
MATDHTVSAPDGGPAFPTHPFENRAADGELIHKSLGDFGMSLRDYFAAAALPGVMHARVALANAEIENDLNQESIAEECYELADALLEARVVKTEEA